MSQTCSAGDHSFWPDGQDHPVPYCTRCGEHNAMLDGYIQMIAERASFLNISWKQAHDRYINWEIEKCLNLKT